MIKSKFKSGAASFYIVAFSTLILVIIAASFASAIIAEITRSSNSDLAQSAYDAALAGIEDAKAAFINYQNCLAAGGESAKPKRPDGDGMVTCSEIVYWMEHARDREDVYDADDTVNGKKINDCDMVGHILGRIPDGDTGEVQIAETTDASTNNNMQQAYTCVIVKTSDSKYVGSLSATSPYRVVKIRLGKDISASDIGSVKISWHKEKSEDEGKDGGVGFNYNIENRQVAFKQKDTNRPVIPPMIAVQMIQTAKEFTLSDLNSRTKDSGQTDRMTVYLVPTEDSSLAQIGEKGEGEKENFIRTFDGTNNVITSVQAAGTNDHGKDYPFMVKCNEEGISGIGFVCSAKIDLPEPISVNGLRSNETFVFVVSVPYGEPTTFALQMVCKVGSDGKPLNPKCTNQELDTAGNPVGDSVAMLDKMQVIIDSTGRANDLFRRLEIRLDPGESTFGFPLYAVQVDDGFEKTLTVTKETGNYSGYNNW